MKVCNIFPFYKTSGYKIFHFQCRKSSNLNHTYLFSRLSGESDLCKVFVKSLRQVNRPPEGTSVREIENFVLSNYQISYQQVIQEFMLYILFFLLHKDCYKKDINLKNNIILKNLQMYLLASELF